MNLFRNKKRYKELEERITRLETKLFFLINNMEINLARAENKEASSFSESLPSLSGLFIHNND